MQTTIGVNEGLELIKVNVTVCLLSSSTYSKVFISETSLLIHLKFNVEPPWIVALIFFAMSSYHDQMATKPLYGSNLSRIFFSRTNGPISMKLGM